MSNREQKLVKLVRGREGARRSSGPAHLFMAYLHFWLRLINKLHFYTKILFCARSEINESGRRRRKFT